MKLGTHTHKVTAHSNAYTARFRRHRKLKDLSAVDTEVVQLRSLDDVPQTDGEVHGSGDEMRRIVAWTLIVWIEQARHATSVTGQHLVRQHIDCTRQTPTTHYRVFYTHTHLFNGPFSGTTQVSWYQKGKNQSGFYGSKKQ